MAFFEQLKGKATELAQAGVAKSKQLAEIAKLKTANMGEEDAIRKAYLEIGKLYYAEHKDAPEGAYVALCDKVSSAQAVIRANKEKIAALKETASVTDEEAKAYADVVEEKDLDEVMDEINDVVDADDGTDEQ